MTNLKIAAVFLAVLTIALPVCKLAFILGGVVPVAVFAIASALIAAMLISDVIDAAKHNEWRERVIFGQTEAQ